MIDRHALLLGATGLVGGHVLDELLGEPTWQRVTVLARKPATREHPKLTWHAVDFDNEATWKPHVGATDLFDCMGTTIKQAGSREAFRHVDLELPLRIATAARAAGARHCGVISSLGASPTARVFYSQVKGELETELRKLHFPSLHLLQPSLLVGDRAAGRLGEKVGAVMLALLRPFLVGSWRKLRAIKAQAVARAMVTLAVHPEPGAKVVLSDELARLGRPPK
jgi:uncharacterized protein YbjT (DUF2867 family)